MLNIISLVSYSFLPARSGGQKGIALFYKYFSQYHAVTILTTEKNQPSLAEGYEVLNTLSSSPLRYVNPFIFFKIRKLFLEKKATHLILEHPYYGWLGVLVKKICGVRLIVHSHNIEGKRWKSLGKWWWPILRSYEKWTHRQADFNFFIQDEDRIYAISSYGLDEKLCLTVSFGTEIPEPPSAESRKNSAQLLHQQLKIPENISLLLFNGAFRYSPNRDALENLVFRINPLLQKKKLSYRILILGLDIPEPIVQANFPDILVLGFVENLELYLTGCDLFLNPLVSGGGIKTKLVEALAYNLNTVSTENGAIGVDPALCNGKLLVCPDGDWDLFSESVVRGIDLEKTMPAAFYEKFYWAYITGRAARFIESGT